MTKNGTKLGVVVLLASGVFCKALGALFRLPLTNLLGIEGIGIFQLVMSMYAFALVVTCGGVTTTLSKLISSARARGEIEKVKVFEKRAFLTSVCTGLLLGLVFLLLSKRIAAFQRIDASMCYVLFIFLLPLGAALATLRGFFQGYQNMTPTAVSQILEQMFKFAFGLLFAYIFAKKSVTQGVFGAFLGIVTSEIVAIIYLFFLSCIKREKCEVKMEFSQLRLQNREFDRANMLLMLSAAIIPLVSAFDGLVIIPRLLVAGLTETGATEIYGLQTGVVGAILNFPLIISIAVTTALLPNISYEISRGTNGRHTIEKGLKMLLFLVLPTTFGVVAVSKPLLKLFYVGMSSELLEVAFNLMLFGGFGVVFTALMQYLVMLLQASGDFRFILGITSFAGVLKVTISYFLAALPSVNIYALVFGNIVMYATICVMALWRLKRKVAFSIRVNDIFALLLGTFAMFAAVYTFLQCDYFHSAVNLVLAIMLGVLVYGVFTVPYSIKILKTVKSK